MSDFISGKEQLLKDTIEFVDKEIRPFATDFDIAEMIPKELIAKMAAKGYLSLPFPTEYGGIEVDPITYGKITEIFGKACSSTRALLTVQTSLVGETILRWGTSEQKNNILPALASGNKLGCFALTEPETGSDAKSISTSYIKKEGFYLLNGKKKWITLGAIANLFFVIASDGKKSTAFLVDGNCEGISISPMKGLLASRAAHIAEIEFKDVKVPTENVLGIEGNGFTHIVNTALDYGRYSIAWGGLAIAQEALETMVAYSRNRKQFGKGIYSFQLIQGMIGDAVTKIHAARALCVKAGEMRLNKHQDAIMETTIAKYFTSKIANQIASDAIQVHGGNGCQNNYPAERLFREAKILEIIEGTSQIQQEMIARYGLRKYFLNKKRI